MPNLVYLAVVKRKIESFLKSSDISREIIEVILQEVERFEEMVNRMLWGSRRRWNKEIRLAIDRFKDAIQLHLSKRSVPLSGRSRTFVEEVILELHSFKERVQEMENDLADELYQSLSEEDEDDDVSSSPICSKMVGLSDQYSELKRKIMNGGARFKVLSIMGMAGVGKTALARKIYEDRDVSEHFDLRAWVTAGRMCRQKEILRRIAAQLGSDTVREMLLEADPDEVVRFLRENLMDKKYLVVLDDVWGKYVKYHLQQSYRYGKNEMKNPFPDSGNGSRVLLTTRLQQVDERNQVSREDIAMRLLNKEESWDLLREKLFGEESCPFKLEKFGKQIAENCDGLPLTIVKIANLLPEEEKILEYWSEIATHRNHQVFLKAYDEVSKVLLPSFKYLPQILQMCILYMGVFPRNYEIHRSKLIVMWETDGFLELKAHKFSYPSAMECLEDLVSNSLVMIHQRTTDFTAPFGGKQIIKTCGLHSSLLYLSTKEGEKSKFFHVLKSFDDGFGEGVEDQHRLSFHNNVLFGIKEVRESVVENCASTAHSLLCYGPYHKYQVPICFGLRLLKKLDALTIRLYEFPLEILQLVQLKYLALTLDGRLPSSISQLRKLQFLIVNQHLSIKSCCDPSFIYACGDMGHGRIATSTDYGK